MATSGTYAFNLDLVDIIEEAYERCGLELRESYSLVTARRSLELLLTEWSNHQVNIWKVVQTSLPMVASTSSYTIADPVIDILDAVMRDTDSLDIPLQRISFEEYLNLTDKTQEGKPTHFATLRGPTSLTLFMWNTPDLSTYTFEYWALRYIEDVGSTFTNNIDIPRRFLPALVAGLTYKIAQKNPAKAIRDPQTGQFGEGPGVGAALRAELKAEYDQLFQLARDEDRDRAPFRINPRIRRV